MKKIYLIIAITLSVNIAFSQDLDIFHRNINDKLQPVKIDSSMTLQEFSLLTTNLRMQDMMYAAIVPGWTHFKAQEPVYGYTLLGIRSMAYMGWAILVIKNYKETENISLSVANVLYGIDATKSDRTFFYITSAMAIGSYVYDWIHGVYMLDKKQNALRYKYSMKFSLSANACPDGKIYPGIGLRFVF